MRIVVIEDDADLREILRISLARSGYDDVVFATDGLTGLERVLNERPALVLLDIMLPKMDGYEVCRCIRASDRAKRVPIIMLTAKSDEEDVVKGLDLGANDYVTKPFSRAVLLARIRAVLRTDAEKRGGQVSFEGLVLDRDTHEVLLGGFHVALTPGEFRLLELLVTRPGRILTRTNILDAIQVEAKDVTDRTVDVMLAHMRPKLGGWASHIGTVRGVGYRLV